MCLWCWNELLSAAKGFDATDRRLRSAVAYRVVQALRMQEKRQKIKRVDKVGNAIVWEVL